MYKKIAILNLKNAILLSIFFILLFLTLILSYVVIAREEENFINIITNKHLTREEQVLLDDMNRKLSQQEYLQVENQAKDIAVSSTAVDIANCFPNPLVFQAENNQFILKNSGKKIHTISFSSQEIYTLEPKDTKKITLASYNGPGLYAYGCDGQQKAVGIVYIVK